MSQVVRVSPDGRSAIVQLSETRFGLVVHGSADVSFFESLATARAGRSWVKPTSEMLERAEAARELAVAADTSLSVIAAEAKRRVYRIPQSVRVEVQRGLKWSETSGVDDSTFAIGKLLGRAQSIDLAGVQRVLDARLETNVDTLSDGFHRTHAGYPNSDRIAHALFGGQSGEAWLNKLARQNSLAVLASAFTFDAGSVYMAGGDDQQSTAVTRLFRVTDGEWSERVDGEWELVDDPSSTVPQLIELDEESANALAQYLDGGDTSAPFELSSIHPLERNLFLLAEARLDWELVDRAVVAAGPPPAAVGGPVGATPPTDGYSPQERSQNAQRQPRATGGRFGSSTAAPSSTPGQSSGAFSKARLDAPLPLVEDVNVLIAQYLADVKANSAGEAAPAVDEPAIEQAPAAPPVKPVTAAGWADDSTSERSHRASKQLRDRFGRWIEMGGLIKFGLPGGGKDSGHVTGIDGPNVTVKSNSTGQDVTVPGNTVEAVPEKGRLDAPSSPGDIAATDSGVPAAPTAIRDSANDGIGDQAMDAHAEMLGKVQATDASPQVKAQAIDDYTGQLIDLREEHNQNGVGPDVADTLDEFDKAINDASSKTGDLDAPAASTGGVLDSPPDLGETNTDDVDTAHAQLQTALNAPGATDADKADAYANYAESLREFKGESQAGYGGDDPIPDDVLDMGYTLDESIDAANSEAARLAKNRAANGTGVQASALVAAGGAPGTPGQANPLYMAIVDDVDTQAVLDIVALVPADDQATDVSAWKRSAGAWVEAPDLLAQLRSTTPPSVVQLTDTAQIKTVLGQVDASDSSDAGPQDETTTEVAPVAASAMAWGDAWGEFGELVAIYDRRGNILTSAVVAGGIPGIADTAGDHEAVKRLQRYWSHGEGAAKVGWGTPGDLTRCHTMVSKYMEGGRAWGFCQLRHHDATGTWNKD